jgi:hypothetical protein
MRLSENNKDIDSLIKHLDKCVIIFKKKYPSKTHSLKEIRNLYELVIIPWMEEYPMNNLEIGDDEDEQMKNKLLDIINMLNVFIK